MSATSDDDEKLLSDGGQSTASESESESEGEKDPPLAAHHNFAPPFYGRPPTPLPPSPSLTSLLRPSRPTTPDASDDDNLEPVPRASPKVPTYEYYGFVLYLFSSLTFLIYLLWSYLPSPFLHALGIYYYPNRWWSLAIPSFLVMSLAYIYIALAAYNTEILSLPLESVETIVDDAADVAVIDARGRLKRGGSATSRRRSRREQHQQRERDGRDDSKAAAAGGGGKELNWRAVWNEATDAVMDVPLAGVCEVLYGDRREDC